MSRLVRGSVLLAMLSGCGGGGDEETLYGPCFIDANEPALTIDGVRNSISGAVIPSFVLSGISVHGHPMVLGHYERPTIAINSRVVGATVECGTPCGFSRQEGMYTFTVSATGYVSKAVTVSGRYAAYAGGCPGLLSGGAHTAFTLNPA